MNDRKKAEQRKTAAFCLAAAAAMLFVCSKSSPLFAFNDWMDANAFYTIGKAMMNGMVLYRDVFDQKGPLLFAVYGLAWLADRDGFFGVLLLEIVCFAAFFYYSCKTVALFVGRFSPLWMLLPGACIAASRPFVHGGSAEELCLPLFAAALYRLLAFACVPQRQRRPLPLRRVLAQGVLAGCVLWVKFNLLGLFLGWVLWFAAAYLRRGWYRQLGQSCGAYLGGMALATLPWLLYFGWNGALPTLFRDYFYGNIFLYPAVGDGSPLLLRLPQRLWWFCHDAPLLALLIGAGMLFVLWQARHTRQTAVLTALLCTGAGLAVGITAAGVYLIYYLLPLAVYAPLGIAAPVQLAQRHGGGRLRWLALPLAAAVCLWMSPNAPYHLRRPEELPQYRFAAAIAAAGPQARLLNYNAIDGGFYTPTGLLPPCRFYCRMNVYGEQAGLEQEELMRAGAVDFVVALDPEVAQRFPAYVQADACTYDSGEGMRTWYLYRRAE